MNKEFFFRIGVEKYYSNLSVHKYTKKHTLRFWMNLFSVKNKIYREKKRSGNYYSVLFG